MSRKRRNTSSPESDHSPPQKRRVSSIAGRFDEYIEDDVQPSDEKPQLNQNSGQVGAFPGLGVDDGELFYGPAVDGIDYLRMVRSEARAFPDVIATTFTPAESRALALSNAEDGNYEDQEDVYYFDGTYAARTNPVTNRATMSPAQSRYYESLLARFRLLQATLRCQPPMDLLGALDGRPITFPAESKVARDTWERYMTEQDPHPVQLASMDADAVFELIRFLTRKLLHLLQKDSEVNKRIGSWAWAVLGKCPQAGEMDSEEVSELRSLAQKAGAAIRRGPLMASKDHSADEDENVETDEDSAAGMVEAEDEDLASRDGANLSSRQMVLDIIVTIVGEVYGQRDLLEMRQAWKPNPGPVSIHGG